MQPQLQTAPNSGVPQIATDPPVSEAQRRAMYAALSGRSTLGIPKSVAEKFVGHAHDMTVEEQEGLFRGLQKFFQEEFREPEHAADVADDPNRGAGVALREPGGKMLFIKRNGAGDQAGTWAFPGGYAKMGENEEAAAIRELGEEIGFLLRQPLRVRFDHAADAFNFSTFVHDVDEEFEPDLNEESDDYQWAFPDQAPQPLHPGVAQLLAGDAFTESDHPRAPDGKWSSGGGGTVKTFHGTTKKLAEQINRQGLKLGKPRSFGGGELYEGDRGRAVFVANTLRTAHWYAKQRIWNKQGGRGEAAVVEIHIPKSEFKKFRKDTMHEGRGSAFGLTSIPAKWIKNTTIWRDNEKVGEYAKDEDGQDFETLYLTVDPEDYEDDELATDHFAFDRATVRRSDADGRLHVEVTNISKANVCPYLGKEIPDWEKLGLQPDKIYQLLRDPEELRKAASTFNNLPLLIEHVPVSADDHQPDLVIGSTGTDAEFSHPYLKNSLVVWAKDAISAIESGSQKELSSAYRYRADMTPGNYQGADYDGVMRNIIGNHVALVKEGRAGTDVVVGDSKPAVIAQHQQETEHMSKTLSRQAVFVKGALTAFLMPKLAQDAKMPDFVSALYGVTNENFAETKPKILEGVKAAFKGVKLAKDANLDDMHGFIDRLDKEAAATDEDPEEKKEGEEKKAFDAEGLKDFLKDKLSEDNMKALDAYLAGDEPPEFAGKPVKEGEDQENEETEKVDQKAMDAAIKVAVDDATKKAIQAQQAIHEAERFVRPWVGELAMAHDSAEAVHRAAAKILGIEGADKVHPDALPHLIKAQPLPGAKPKQDTTVAMDAATIDDFNARFPMASRIGIL